MDYSRFNYVAQPEDNIEPADLIPKIGPYDKWATMWGYKPIPERAHAGRREADARRVGARAGQDAVATLLDGAGAAAPIRANKTEAVGDADAVQATTLGPEEPAACRRHAAVCDDDAAR